jgi:glucosamine--fructose-6-phosphate aminotransferase (isomerizing)
MCSVVGYIGKNYSKAHVMEGLTRLEYRGYDSAGFACLDPLTNKLFCLKARGLLSNLVEKTRQNSSDGFSGIGHTRWSTHGVPNEQNAHPQFDCHKMVSLVHNGIIENQHVLKQELISAGHIFRSESDTEVAAHALEAILEKEKNLIPAIVQWLNRLHGAYAFIVLLENYPDSMIVVRKRSPICLGIGADEMFVASDALAFAGKTKQAVYLPDESFAVVHKKGFELYSFDGTSIVPEIKELTISWANNEKMGLEHFMLKEIYEQKGAIHATVAHCQALGETLFEQLGLSKKALKASKSLSLLGCGTSWHAARIAQFFFEKIAELPTRVLLASEFRYMPFFAEKETIHITLSQSGETADTLEALRMIKTMHMPTVALTNVASSTLAREADGFLLTQAGPEIAVASTKAFSTQLAALYWLANRIALEKGIITQQQMDEAVAELLMAAELLESSIERYKQEIINSCAKKYAPYKKAIFLGRHISYPFAMEAALKLKEISYVFAQCYPAGELKHGPIALIDQDVPVYIFSTTDPVIYQKLVSNAQEVKARSGHLVVFAFEGQQELFNLADQLFVFPAINPLLGPLVMTGLMQFFVYSIAKELGKPIDKPRNLAKSVTVE